MVRIPHLTQERHPFISIINCLSVLATLLLLKTCVELSIFIIPHEDLEGN